MMDREQVAELVAEAISAAGSAERAAADLEAAARRRDAAVLAMADAGMSLALIGASLSITRQAAHKLVCRARATRSDEWGGQGTGRVRPAARLRDDFAAACHAAFLAAEARTHGNMLNPAGLRAGADPAGFFAAYGRRTPIRYASEELVEHFAESGRPASWHEWRRAA